MATIIELKREAPAVSKSAQPERKELPLPRSLPVIWGQRLTHGHPMICGWMPAHVLIPHNYHIPIYDPKTGKGYQRPLHEGRVNELVSALKKHQVSLPTGILLNLRDIKWIDGTDYLTVETEENDPPEYYQQATLSLEFLRDGTNRKVFHVIDGQHRVTALRKLIEDEPSSIARTGWEMMCLPFTCIMGATEDEEMEQFYLVNSRAKSVRTDLALALLRKLPPRKYHREWLDDKEKDWQVDAVTLVEALAESSSVWRGLIQLPGMEKGISTVPSSTMVASLKPLFSSSFFSRLIPEQQHQVVEAYWAGVRAAMQSAFDHPLEFVIQKGVGVTVLHAILVDVLELIRSSNGSVVDPAAYRQIVAKPLELLQGEAQDGRGSLVQGLNFWRVAPKGAAGSFSSSAGRRVLIAKIRQLLPKMKLV